MNRREFLGGATAALAGLLGWKGADGGVVSFKPGARQKCILSQDCTLIFGAPNETMLPRAVFRKVQAGTAIEAGDFVLMRADGKAYPVAVDVQIYGKARESV
jgi:hypothetical protein